MANIDLGLRSLGQSERIGPDTFDFVSVMAWLSRSRSAQRQRCVYVVSECDCTSVVHWRMTVAVPLYLWLCTAWLGRLQSVLCHWQCIPTGPGFATSELTEALPGHFFLAQNIYFITINLLNDVDLHSVMTLYFKFRFWEYFPNHAMPMPLGMAWPWAWPGWISMTMPF